MKIRASTALVFARLLAISLCLPAASFALPDTPEQRAGEISRVIPAVSIMRGGQSMAADTKAPVYWQDELNTLASGRARVSLDDGSILNLGSSSNLRVAKHDAGAQQTELAVGLGKIRIQAQKISRPSGKFEVRTPAGVAGVIGTDFYVGYEGDTMSVIVFEGRVKFCNLAGVCVEVGAGEMSTARQNDTSGPAAPAPAPAALVSSAIGSTSVEFYAQAIPAENTPLGMVTKSMSARIGSSPSSEGATIYSGDYLSTDADGVLQVRVGNLSVDLKGGSSAHIFRATYGVVIALNRGTLAYNKPSGQPNVVIVASDVRITPVVSVASSGSVSVDDPCNLLIHSQLGQVYVQVGSASQLVEQGKAFRVRPISSVSERISMSPDADNYHESHQHQPCQGPAQTFNNQRPKPPSFSTFTAVAVGVAIVGTAIPLVGALESPSRP
ncbi:MAG TPA: FecR family protein [Candidatus Udaeobacter sp.]|nr:FecR family protein [Candidatus Udaeobacter sp.]